MMQITNTSTKSNIRSNHTQTTPYEYQCEKLKKTVNSLTLINMTIFKSGFRKI